MTILYSNRTLRIRKNLILFYVFFYLKFSKSHTSQTFFSNHRFAETTLWHGLPPYKTTHISQTRRRAGNPAVRFTTICLSNMPLNFLSSFEACLPYKITYFSNRQAAKARKAAACLPYKITYFSN